MLTSNLQDEKLKVAPCGYKTPSGLIYLQDKKFKVAPCGYKQPSVASYPFRIKSSKYSPTWVGKSPRTLPHLNSPTSFPTPIAGALVIPKPLFRSLTAHKVLVRPCFLPDAAFPVFLSLSFKTGYFCGRISLLPSFLSLLPPSSHLLGCLDVLYYLSISLD